MSSPLLQHVSDTALWVAHYRAEESNRRDRLFDDPFAERLAGEKGREIAKSMKDTSRYTAWTLSIRTHILDEWIYEKIEGGIDTILNLGAGLDSRPYRLRLPKNLNWIEIDYPHMIDYKENILANEQPLCRLERFRLDLSDRSTRQETFSNISARSQNILVLTEGVIPYLSEKQMSELAHDLHTHPSFRFWIAEYFSPMVYTYLRSPKQNAKMGNTPFQFFPDDWFGFFRKYGWRQAEIRYMVEESIRLKRRVPMPWWSRLLGILATSRQKESFFRSSGFVIYVPEN